MGYKTQQELNEEYQRKCSEDERAARQIVSNKADQRRAELENERLARQQEREHLAATAEQCREMGRILAERRKRVDSMSTGELGDLERFKANFNDRCKGR